MIPKVIFIPGNGGGSPKDNWFPYLKNELQKLGLKVVDSEFPDNILARESYWIPFLKEVLQADEHTILVGYSSGAVAAMRYAEKNKILGTALVSAYCTDLSLADEKESGYFTRPWDWESIKKNQKWILQFASLDDSLIPIEEARLVHEKLNSEFYEFGNQGHFNFNKFVFPELLEGIKNHIKREY